MEVRIVNNKGETKYISQYLAEKEGHLAKHGWRIEDVSEPILEPTETDLKEFFEIQRKMDTKAIDEYAEKAKINTQVKQIKNKSKK